MEALESEQAQLRIALSNEEQKNRTEVAKASQKQGADGDRIAQLESSLKRMKEEMQENEAANAGLRTQVNELKGKMAEKQRSLEQR